MKKTEIALFAFVSVGGVFLLIAIIDILSRSLR